MRELTTTAEQAVLLPQQTTTLYLAFFYRSSQPGQELRDLCGEIAPITRFELVAVDLDKAPALADRFSLSVLPALAAIFDGMILCIDDELSDATCRDLSELALIQQSLLEKASS